MANLIIKQTPVITVGRKAGSSQTIGYIVYFLFGLIEALLFFRLVFKIIGANPSNNFVTILYSITQILIAPFFGIFHQSTGTGLDATAILEPATLVATVCYAVLAWGIIQILIIFSGRLN